MRSLRGPSTHDPCPHCCACPQIFARTSSSLRYDKNRRQFVTVLESRHPLYRALLDALAHHNERVRRLKRARVWLRSIMEIVRVGLHGKGRGHKVPRLMRLKGTLDHLRWVRGYRETIVHKIPIPPITGQLPVRAQHRPVAAGATETSGTKALGRGFLTASGEVGVVVSLAFMPWGLCVSVVAL
jgi:hypothetical protein